MTNLSQSLTASQLLDALTSAALMVDVEKGQVVYANPEFINMSGYAANEIQGKKLSFFLKLPSKTDCAFCLNLSTSDKTQWATIHGAQLLTAAEKEVRIKIKHSLLPDNTVLCLIDTFSEDATLTQAHSDFVSTVSHEFRTPLTSIKGFADTLLSYGGQLPEEEKRRFINIIKDQADRLIRLVENLLTVSKLGASRIEMSFRPVPLPKLIDKVVQSIQAKANTERTFKISIAQSLPDVWADADRLEQVLLNLVDNAVKYSRPESLVEITGEVIPPDSVSNENLIRIRISDQGVGIPQEMLPRLFSKFYRIDNHLTRDVEGTGLGLYITKSLTAAMGGQIEVESEPDVGTTFTLTFPAATPERQASHRRRLYAENAE